jgi:hypothetical protein
MAQESLLSALTGTLGMAAGLRSTSIPALERPDLSASLALRFAAIKLGGRLREVQVVGFVEEG